MRMDTTRENMILDEKVLIFIVMASELFKKQSSAVFKQYGLTFSHYNVLKYLSACEDGRDTVGNVSKHMLVTGANVTGLAKRMQKAGLIERRNDVKDERLTLLQISPSGLKTLRAIRVIQERHVAEYLQSYSQEDKERVLSVLKHIVRQGKRLSGSKR